MSFVYDAAIVAYPLYQTSKLLQTSTSAAQVLTADTYRWLHFWITFGGFKMLENAGANNIPFFYGIQTVMLLSMYSIEQSVLVGRALPKIANLYIRGVDRCYELWDQQNIVTKEHQTRVTGAWNRVSSFFWRTTERTERTEPPSEKTE